MPLHRTAVALHATMGSQDGCGYDFLCDDGRAEARLEAKASVPDDRAGEALAGDLAARPVGPVAVVRRGAEPLSDFT